MSSLSFDGIFLKLTIVNNSELCLNYYIILHIQLLMNPFKKRVLSLK